MFVDCFVSIDIFHTILKAITRAEVLHNSSYRLDSCASFYRWPILSSLLTIGMELKIGLLQASRFWYIDLDLREFVFSISFFYQRDQNRFPRPCLAPACCNQKRLCAIMSVHYQCFCYQLICFFRPIWKGLVLILHLTQNKNSCYQFYLII